MIVDFVGIGFGPSNLSTAVAIEEHNKSCREDEGLCGYFLESKESFEWHENMLLEDATMQISFLKDLVTLRNPCSDFSFISYLKSKGRLEKFINLKDFYPTRVEYNDYYKWAAKRLDNYVYYSSRVVNIVPVNKNGTVDYVEVHYETNENGSLVSKKIVTKSLIVSMGLDKKVPKELAVDSSKVFHNSEFLKNIESFNREKDNNFLVVGAGQSSAEIAEYLHNNFPKSKVNCLFSKFAYMPADDSAFVNQVFDLENVDMFYGCDESVRKDLLSQLAPTNYSVVDIDLIKILYSKYYKEVLSGDSRLNFINMSYITNIEKFDDEIVVTIADRKSKEVYEMKFDGVVLCTGYTPKNIIDIFPELSDYIVPAENGSLQYSRDYFLKTKNNFYPNIAVQGASEDQHGITNTLLSILPHRSGEILSKLVEEKSSTEVFSSYSVV